MEGARIHMSGESEYTQPYTNYTPTLHDSHTSPTLSYRSGHVIPYTPYTNPTRLKPMRSLKKCRVCRVCRVVWNLYKKAQKYRKAVQ